MAVISRSLATARYAVPSFVYLRNSVVPTVSTRANARAITCVQFTNAPKSVNVWLELGRGEEAGEGAAHGSAPRHDPEQDQREPEGPHHLDERVPRREGGAEHQPVERG